MILCRRKYSAKMCYGYFGVFGIVRRTSHRRVALLEFIEARVIGMQIDQPAADDRGDGRAVHRASVKRSVAALRLGPVDVEDPFQLRIENRHVRMRTLL